MMQGPQPHPAASAYKSRRRHPRALRSDWLAAVADSSHIRLLSGVDSAVMDSCRVLETLAR